MYTAPHVRHRNSQYFRENKNVVKSHQKEYVEVHAPIIRRKRRPKREVTGGYKMSYRYKYYIDDVVEEEEIEEDSE